MQVGMERTEMRGGQIRVVRPELARVTERPDPEHCVPKLDLPSGGVGQGEIKPRREEDEVRREWQAGLAELDGKSESQATPS